MKSSGKLVNVLPKPAVVSVLGGLSEKRHYPAQLTATQGREMKLQVEVSIPCGAAVKIDVDGGLVLGTAVCMEAGENGAVLTVEIDQVIPDTAGLARLVSAVLGQKPPATVTYIPQEEQSKIETHDGDPVLRPSSR